MSHSTSSHAPPSPMAPHLIANIITVASYVLMIMPLWNELNPADQCGQQPPNCSTVHLALTELLLQTLHGRIDQTCMHHRCVSALKPTVSLPDCLTVSLSDSHCLNVSLSDCRTHAVPLTVPAPTAARAGVGITR